MTAAWTSARPWALRGLLAALLVLAPGGIQADERGTAREAQELVRRAIDLYDTMGLRAFFVISWDRSYIHKDLYVFVIDRIGSVAANGLDPRLVGMNALNARDPDGVRYVREMLQRATPDGVWIDYISFDPFAGKPAPKSSWVVRHDGFLFGCGIYAGDISI